MCAADPAGNCRRGRQHLRYDRLAVSGLARNAVAARNRCAALLAVGRTHGRRRASTRAASAGAASAGAASARAARARAAATRALGRAGQNGAGQASAAVGTYCAATCGGHATGTIADIRWGSARIRDAGKVAAVGAGSARLAGEARRGLSTVDCRDQAAWDAQDVLLASVILHHVAGAAVRAGAA